MDQNHQRRPERLEPFNDLPGLPSYAKLETNAVREAAAAAHSALDELNRLPADEIERDALTSAAAIVEADASAAIEGYESSVHDIAIHRLRRGHSEPQTEQALGCMSGRKVLTARLQERPVSTGDLTEACSNAKLRQIHLRTGRCVIANAEGVVYTPPEATSRILRMTKELCTFLGEADSANGLVRMAASHYQFESIHPFDDGNGRVGRMLNAATMVAAGIAGATLLPLSRGIAEQRSRYYELLNETRYGNDSDRYDAWICFLLERIVRTAKWTKEVWKLRQARAGEQEERLNRAFAGSVPETLVRLACLRPATTPHEAVQAGAVGTARTARTKVKRLCMVGLLTEYGNRASVNYVNREAASAWERVSAPRAKGW